MLSKRHAVAGAAAAVAVLAAAALAAERPGGPRAGRAPAVVVSGSVHGLFPGARRPLVLTVRNRRSFPIRVIRVGVRVGSAPRCSGRYLRTGRLRRPLRVPRRAARRVTIWVSMSARAPDACRGARFPLTYRAFGVRL